MSTLTDSADIQKKARELAKRGKKASDRICDLVDIIRTDVDYVAAGSSAKGAGDERSHQPDGSPESPTNHHDPVGENAITGSTGHAVRIAERQLTVIEEQLDALHEAFNQAEWHIAPIVSAGPIEVAESKLCPGHRKTCGDLKANGHDLCDSCRLERDTEARHTAGVPTCCWHWQDADGAWFQCDQAVERRVRKGREVYVGMTWDGSQWQPNPEAAHDPYCAAHRSEWRRLAA